MKDYYQLVKPGILYGNAMTALATFCFASKGIPDFTLLLATLVGLSLSIAAACVVNNIIDRDIDVFMERTKDRVLVTGRVTVRHAAIYAAVLGGMGFGVLYFFTNIYALLITLFGVVIYLGAYTPAKRFTQHSTIIGSLSGAVPPVVGYTAVTGVINSTAIILFLILVAWQMTHFFAIAIFRKEEYQMAKLPIMSVRAGVTRTKVLMLVYAVVLLYASLLLAYTERLGLLYIVPVGGLSIGWILLCIQGFRTTNERKWARTTFLYSIVFIIVFSITLALS